MIIFIPNNLIQPTENERIGVQGGGLGAGAVCPSRVPLSIQGTINMTTSTFLLLGIAKQSKFFTKMLVRQRFYDEKDYLIME